MSRKYDSIDIVKLYSGMLPGFEDDFLCQKQYQSDGAKHNTIFKKEDLTAHEKWNHWLEKCLDEGNIYELVKVRYGLQVGMDNLAKKKLNTEPFVEMFLRWTGSIERTARKILRTKYPIPTNIAEGYKQKKLRDHEFELFLRKSSF